MESAKSRLNENLKRVRNLLRIYAALAKNKRGRKPIIASDVLRSATVFLHASLEDFLRTLAIDRLPFAEPSVLDEVPLVGQGTTGRAQKFLLGTLADHRGKSVQQVINESVTAYLARSNYNDMNEISALLKNLKLRTQYPQAVAQGVAKTLAELMKRRHNIVHRADRADTKGSGHHRVQSISKAKVQSWIDAVQKFANNVKPSPSSN